MLPAQRRDLLLDRLERDGRLVAKDLAAELGIAEDSVRRDLRELAAAGLCQRVYGGALPVSPAIADYATRLAVAPDSKQRVAAAAARLVRPGSTVLLDGGTTALAVARGAAPRPGGHRRHPQPDHRRSAGRPPDRRGLRARRAAVQALRGHLRRRRRRSRTDGARRPVPARGHRRAPRRRADDRRPGRGRDEARRSPAGRPTPTSWPARRRSAPRRPSRSYRSRTSAGSSPTPRPTIR